MGTHKLWIWLTLAFLCCGSLYGQQCDSLPRADHTHDFRFSGVLLPSAFIGYGTAVTFFPDLQQMNVAVKEWSQEKIRTVTTVDNFLQFVPAAGVYALNGCGVRGTHRLGDLTALTALSYILGTGVNTSIKYSTRVLRPDGSAHNSFPSGHTMTAFVGAEILRREYGREHPWLAVGGYTVAAAVGMLRMSNNWHWMADVFAGAGIGMLSTSLVYWTYPYLRDLVTSSGNCTGYLTWSSGAMLMTASLKF